jgi:hypothetical protein
MVPHDPISTFDPDVQCTDLLRVRAVGRAFMLLEANEAPGYGVQLRPHRL